ncbi:Succinate dehydrogenase assembly factor 2, mitochondrial, partial [Linum perenne]
NNGDSVDLSNEESKRRLCNRLLYRSRQRGFLELDLVLGKWENPDLWKWLTGQEQPPDGVCQNPVLCEIRDKVMNNLSSHSAAETRAVPGQPWVRGWDDIKKTAGGAPVAGNQ